MTPANRYFRFSKLSERTFRSILECFAKDLTATYTAGITGVSVRSVNAIFLRIRQRSAEACERQALHWPFREAVCPQVLPATDDGAPSRNVVLGLFEHCGKIYTEIVSGPMKSALQALLRGHATLQTLTAAGQWRGYDALVDLEFDRFLRLGREQEADVRSAVEAFWDFAERRLRKFHGLPGRTFWLHVKECEFRYNHRDQDLFSIIQKLLLRNPL